MTISASFLISNCIAKDNRGLPLADDVLDALLSHVDDKIRKTWKDQTGQDVEDVQDATVYNLDRWKIDSPFNSDSEEEAGSSYESPRSIPSPILQKRVEIQQLMAPVEPEDKQPSPGPDLEQLVVRFSEMLVPESTEEIVQQVAVKTIQPAAGIQKLSDRYVSITNIPAAYPQDSQMLQYPLPQSYSKPTKPEEFIEHGRYICSTNLLVRWL